MSNCADAENRAMASGAVGLRAAPISLLRGRNGGMTLGASARPDVGPRHPLAGRQRCRPARGNLTHVVPPMPSTASPAVGAFTPSVADAPEFRVAADGLNLRSAPSAATSATRIAVLPRGAGVRRVSPADDPAWWLVSTVLAGTPVEGYVAHRYLEPADAFVPPPAHASVRAVHLREDRPDVTRDSIGSAYAYPLGEPGRPRRTKNASPAERARELGEIVRWLDVERRHRYRRVGNTTYCNIYATDYAYLAGAYLPRVWWTGGALARLARGESVEVRYDVTVREMTANMLHAWLVDFGPQFGWRRTVDADALQRAVNDGAVGIVCAQRRDLERPGHIAAVVPETGDRRATRSGGRVTIPLQSQAGTSNHGYCCTRWWTNAKFRDFGFWMHD